MLISERLTYLALIARSPINDRVKNAWDFVSTLSRIPAIRAALVMLAILIIALSIRSLLVIVTVGILMILETRHRRWTDRPGPVLKMMRSVKWFLTGSKL